MEENGRGCISFAERIPVMWDLRSPINQAIAQRLVNRDGTFRSVKAKRPRSCPLRFGRKIQA